MNLLLAGVTYFFIFLFWLIPFRLLYKISDFIAFILIKSGYRLKTVKENLRKCFPEKSDAEIKLLIDSFYKNLSDVLLEGFKSFTMSRHQISKRHKVLNPEICNKYLNEGKSVIGLPCHYGNWEWGSLSASIFFKQNVIAFYKPLTNKYIDKIVRKNRSRFGTKLITIFETTNSFKKFTPNASVFIMAADQSPSTSKNVIWVDFIGRKTAFLYGPEKHARTNNIPVFFVDIQRIKRGYYSLELSLISDSHQELEHGEITKMFANKLEEVIYKKPQNWLWSHRRWKLENSTLES